LQEFKKAAEDVKRELSVEDDVKSLRDSVEKEKNAGE
jgi:hypothetical protein